MPTKGQAFDVREEEGGRFKMGRRQRDEKKARRRLRRHSLSAYPQTTVQPLFQVRHTARHQIRKLDALPQHRLLLSRGRTPSGSLRGKHHPPDRCPIHICSTCGGQGHVANACPSAAVILTEEKDEYEEFGLSIPGELVGVAEVWIGDSATSGPISPSEEHKTEIRFRDWIKALSLEIPHVQSRHLKSALDFYQSIF